MTAVGLFAGFAWVGFAGQMLLMARWVIQWAASERYRAVVIPLVFWWMSLTGSLAMAVYGTVKDDWVIVVGQPACVAVYARNLFLVYRAARRARP